MFCVEWLATPPEEQQLVLPGSLGGGGGGGCCLPYHLAIPTRFQLGYVRGLCRPVHHYNPSISKECCAISGSVWSSVVMLKHLYLWMVLHEWFHLLQDFVPIPHSIEVPLHHNKISTASSRNPTPHHAPCHICLFTDAWVCQSFVPSFPHSISSINPLKHERAFI